MPRPKKNLGIQGSKLKRIRAIAKGLAEGKTQRQAAIDAGLPEKSADVEGNKIARLPETQALVAKLREKHNLGPSRFFQELDRGLKESDPSTSKHSDYLDKIAKLNDLAQDKPQESPTSQIIIGLFQAFESAEKAGIIDVVSEPPQEE